MVLVIHEEQERDHSIISLMMRSRHRIVLASRRLMGRRGEDGGHTKLDTTMVLLLLLLV
jgi:hypothetical protein